MPSRSSNGSTSQAPGPSSANPQRPSCMAWRAGLRLRRVHAVSTVTDEIKARVDLVELIGRAVQLKRSGSSFKGMCPFHQEKTPSFHVFPHSHTWVCFGCGKKGSAFDWLMEREHLDFGEALRALANQTGVQLPERRDPEQEETTRRLYSLLERAQAYYQSVLWGTAGIAA